MRLGSEFPETLGAILLGGKRQPPIQGKCLDEEGQLRCLLKPGSLGTWPGLAHPEGLVLCSGLGSAGGGWPFPGKGALPARLRCEQPTCWDPRIQRMRCSGNGSRPPAMTALWLPTEDEPSHGNPPCTSTSWLCARSSGLASLSFNFWICKMGMIVASSSQCWCEEKISMLPGYRKPSITILILMCSCMQKKISNLPGIVLGYFTRRWK